MKEQDAGRTYRWEEKTSDAEQVRSLSAVLNDLPLPLARALVIRGVTTFAEAERFFRPSTSHLHDPFLMQDMEQAAERVAEAVLSKQRVLVYGDYDVDGVTSTVLMTTFLRSVGIDVDFFIPHRSIHGYGLCRAGLDHAVQQDCALVIALDCGITAVEEARYAREIGLDLIICDHHTPGPELPDAVAVLDPKREDCAYPYPYLSGCGVGYKLAEAVVTLLGEDPEKATGLLDLVAISIAADIVPISGENRVLMRAGLELLQQDKRVGTSALARKARIEMPKCNTSQIVFGIAPRINAAGRLTDAADAANLLLETDQHLASTMAAVIEETNDRRRAMDMQIQEEAIGMATGFALERPRDAFVLFSSGWHPGVIGITASRIVERFFRPTVMLTKVDGTLKGSARSIFGVNVYDALKECSDLLIKFGGHDFAAGMQLEEASLEEFRDRFEAAVSEQLTDELRMPTLRIDSTLKLDEIDRRFWAVLSQFEPFGPANSRPVFHATNLDVVGEPRTMGKKSEHLKFSVRHRDAPGGRPLAVVGFGMSGYQSIIHESMRCGMPLEMVFTVDENEWKRQTTMQLRLKDLRLEGAAVEWDRKPLLSDAATAN